MKDDVQLPPCITMGVARDKVSPGLSSLSGHLGIVDVPLCFKHVAPVHHTESTVLATDAVVIHFF